MKRSLLPSILLIPSLLLLAASAWAETGQPSGPVVGNYNSVSYLSGGIGEEERQKIEQMAEGYNLKLVFALTEGNYLALVDVLIKDSTFETVLKVESGGPWFYVRLPPGRYLVEAATLQGYAKQRMVEVSAGRMREEVFTWKPGPGAASR